MKDRKALQCSCGSMYFHFIENESADGEFLITDYAKYRCARCREIIKINVDQRPLSACPVYFDENEEEDEYGSV